MIKSHKPLSSKKPPGPQESHEPIRNWIADAKPSLNPLVEALDTLIRKQLADPRFAIKWGKAYYGTPPHGWCIEVVAYDVSVNIVFLNGSRLKSPPEDGGETRYVKLTKAEELGSSQIQEWIRESCNTAGWAW